MKTNAMAVGIGCALALSCSLALAQISSTNSTSTAEPAPMIHTDRQSHDTVTNAIVDPSGSLATNQIPAATNMPTPLAPAPNPSPLGQ